MYTEAPMTKSVLSVRIPGPLKEQAEGILAQLGITPPRAVTLFYEQVVEHRGLPWEVPAIDVEAGPRSGIWRAPTSPMPSKNRR
jgi:hypothetical protein